MQAERLFALEAYIIIYNCPRLYIHKLHRSTTSRHHPSSSLTNSFIGDKTWW